MDFDPNPLRNTFSIILNIDNDTLTDPPPENIMYFVNHPIVEW